MATKHSGKVTGKSNSNCCCCDNVSKYLYPTNSKGCKSVSKGALRVNIFSCAPRKHRYELHVAQSCEHTDHRCDKKWQPKRVACLAASFSNDCVNTCTENYANPVHGQRKKAYAAFQPWLHQISIQQSYSLGWLYVDCACVYSPNWLSIYFLIANFAPQTEHLPSAVIFGCSGTSAPQSPHFTIISPPQVDKQHQSNLFGHQVFKIVLLLCHSHTYLKATLTKNVFMTRANMRIRNMLERVRRKKREGFSVLSAQFFQSFLSYLPFSSFVSGFVRVKSQHVQVQQSLDSIFSPFPLQNLYVVWI